MNAKILYPHGIPEPGQPAFSWQVRYATETLDSGAAAVLDRMFANATRSVRADQFQLGPDDEPLTVLAREVLQAFHDVYVGLDLVNGLRLKRLDVAVIGGHQYLADAENIPRESWLQLNRGDQYLIALLDVPQMTAEIYEPRAALTLCTGCSGCA